MLFIISVFLLLSPVFSIDLPWDLTDITARPTAPSTAIPDTIPTDTSVDIKVSDYKVDNSSSLYDMIPLYVCNNSDSAFPLSEWYGICKYQCSYSNPTTTWSVKFFIRKDILKLIPVTLLELSWQERQSHESVTGYCTIFVTKQSTLEYNYSQIIQASPGILNNTRSGDIGIYESLGDPPCNYWSDSTSAGMVIAYKHEQWHLIMNNTGHLFLRDPTTMAVVDYSDAAVLIGTQWAIWVVENFNKDEVCLYSDDMISSCTFSPLTGLANCHDSGRIINTNNQATVLTQCVGKINISSNGIPYQILSIVNTPAIKPTLASLDTTDPNIYMGMSGLLSTLADTITVLEKTYCSSLCDLADRSFQMIIKNEDVVDTANGPWLPNTEQGNMSVIPCRVNNDYTIKFPLEVCVKSNYIKVVGINTSGELWWDPLLTYVSHQSNCTSSGVNDYSDEISRGVPIELAFWRGTAALFPPYTGPILWTVRENPLSIRSSKWFPTLKRIAGEVPFTMQNLSDGIISSVNVTSADTHASSWKVKNLGNQTLFFVKKIYTDVSLAVQSIFSWFGSTGKIIMFVLITVVLGYVIKILFIFKSTRPRTEWHDMY